MGSWDNASLSENSVLIGRHADRFARWPINSREALQEPTATNHDRDGRKARQGIARSQIRWVFRTDTGLSLHPILLHFFILYRFVKFNAIFNWFVLLFRKDLRTSSTKLYSQHSNHQSPRRGRSVLFFECDVMAQLRITPCPARTHAPAGVALRWRNTKSHQWMSAPTATMFTTNNF